MRPRHDSGESPADSLHIRTGVSNISSPQLVDFFEAELLDMVYSKE